jgi:Domain of unknown function DUF11
MRSLLAALAFSLPLFAASDMQVTSFTLDKTTGVTGERVNAVVRVKNNGPDPATSNVAVGLSGDGITVVSASGPVGWTCRWSYSSSGTCTAASFAAGAEAELRFTFLLSTRPDPNPRITATVSHPTDTVPTNNSMQRPLPVTAANDRADLTLELTPDAVVVPESAQGLMRLTVRNDGPAAARDVVVTVQAAERHGKPAPFTPSGTGWTCISMTPSTAQCVRQSLAAGQSSQIDLRFPAPPYETDVSFQARAVAELNHDPSGAADFKVIGIGSAENWHRLLIPVGSLRFVDLPWHVDLRMLVRSDTPLEIAPHPCELITITCPYGAPYPLQRQFDAYFTTFLPYDLEGHPGAQFLYIRPQDRDRIHINARVYDERRLDTTGGSEIPVAHDEDFKNGLISLLNVPAGTGYRQMLRVYDTFETAGTTVEVRVFADDELAPRVTQTIALEDLDGNQTTTSARLWIRPRYTQLDLRSLDAELAGAKLLRIEVEPMTPGSRIWAFATATNNATHHVTVLSPQ